MAAPLCVRVAQVDSRDIIGFSALASARSLTTGPPGCIFGVWIPSTLCCQFSSSGPRARLWSKRSKMGSSTLRLLGGMGFSRRR